jgi:hypothetical protein
VTPRTLASWSSRAVAAAHACWASASTAAMHAWRAAGAVAAPEVVAVMATMAACS